MMFFPITTQASISVIIISVLLIIVHMGVLMIVGIVGFTLYVKYERPSVSKNYYNFEEGLNLSIIVTTVFTKHSQYNLSIYFKFIAL